MYADTLLQRFFGRCLSFFLVVTPSLERASAQSPAGYDTTFYNALEYRSIGPYRALTRHASSSGMTR